MSAVVLVLISLLACVGAVDVVRRGAALVRRQRSLPPLDSSTTGLGVAGYVSEFREFVRNIEGDVPAEVETALKYLEQVEARGALQARVEALEAAPTAGSRLPLATAKQIASIQRELDSLSYSDRPGVLKEWAERYSFTTDQRVALLESLSYSDRPKVRKAMQVVD